MEPGSVEAIYDLVFNAPIREMEDNVRYSLVLDAPWVQVLPETGRRAVICAAGPSLKDTFRFVEAERAAGSLIVALNGTAEWMADRGLIPDILVMVDCSSKYVKYIEKRPSFAYYLASQVNPGVFDSLKEEDVTIFHLAIPEMNDLLKNSPGHSLVIGGGTTVGLVAMSLMYALGYRDIHLHGYDSSYRGDMGHVYSQEEVPPVEVTVRGRTFVSAPWMVHQAEQWQILVKELTRLGCDITVHGDGLIPYIAWTNSLQP